MKWFFKSKDGGSESNVTGYWLVESKRFIDIVVLEFAEGSREAFHTHAFNSVWWCIKGHAEEELRSGERIIMKPSWIPGYTPRERFHRVLGIAPKTYFIAFRGPWIAQWKEYIPSLKKYFVLGKGRKIVGEFN